MSGRRRTNEQLAAIFASLRKQGKLKLYKDTYWNPNTGKLLVNIKLRGPEALEEMQELYKSRTGRRSRSIEHLKRRYLPHDPVLMRGHLDLTPFVTDFDSTSPPRADGIRPAGSYGNYVRPHVIPGATKPWLKKQRLGTALYVLMLREAKKLGYKGLHSSPPRSRAATKVWKRIRTHSNPYVRQLHYMDSVQPHAKRRGAQKRMKRKQITEPIQLGPGYSVYKRPVRNVQD